MLESQGLCIWTKVTVKNVDAEEGDTSPTELLDLEVLLSPAGLPHLLRLCEAIRLQGKRKGNKGQRKGNKGLCSKLAKLWFLPGSPSALKALFAWISSNYFTLGPLVPLQLPFATSLLTVTHQH
jgi:hypothetical protein